MSTQTQQQEQQKQTQLGTSLIHKLKICNALKSSNESTFKKVSQVHSRISEKQSSVPGFTFSSKTGLKLFQLYSETLDKAREEERVVEEALKECDVLLKSLENAESSVSSTNTTSTTTTATTAGQHLDPGVNLKKRKKVSDSSTTGASPTTGTLKVSPGGLSQKAPPKKTKLLSVYFAMSVKVYVIFTTCVWQLTEERKSKSLRLSALGTMSPLNSLLMPFGSLPLLSDGSKRKPSMKSWMPRMMKRTPGRESIMSLHLNDASSRTKMNNAMQQTVLVFTKRHISTPSIRL